MKTTIQKIGVVIVLSFLTIVTFTLTSCQKEQVARSAQSDQALNSNSAVAQADYKYYIGGVAGDPIRGLDTVVTPVGDTFIIRGSGTLSVPANTVTGSGTFRYSKADGTKRTRGTWSALELLNFTSWGTSPDFPSNFEAGVARIRINTLPNSGENGLDALLFIFCVLPGAAVPPAFEEGVQVNILGLGKHGDVPNFTEQVGGQTLFIRQ